MSTSESFIAHLIELRKRLLNITVVLLVVFIGLFPWASDLYTLLAKPMLAKLPKGGQMIATDVTTPFFVPLKVAMMAALDRKSTRLNSSHSDRSRMPSSA